MARCSTGIIGASMARTQGSCPPELAISVKMGLPPTLVEAS